MSYYYLGSPYSKHPDGPEEAFRQVCVEAGALIRAGMPVYSPIAHSHPIAEYAEMDPFDHSIWMVADEPLMWGARCGLIVLMLDGWETSYGLAEEIKFFRQAMRPIVYMTPGIIPDELRVDSEFL
ncbi:MAG: DUF1937 family protein [Methylocella sp.]